MEEGGREVLFLVELTPFSRRRTGQEVFLFMQKPIAELR